jgi:hypothetical protein
LVTVIVFVATGIIVGLGVIVDRVVIGGIVIATVIIARASIIGCATEK